MISTSSTSCVADSLSVSDKSEREKENALDRSLFDASADLFDTTINLTARKKPVPKSLKKTWLNRISKGGTPLNSPRSPMCKTRKKLEWGQCDNGIEMQAICG